MGQMVVLSLSCWPTDQNTIFTFISHPYTPSKLLSSIHTPFLYSYTQSFHCGSFLYPPTPFVYFIPLFIYTTVIAGFIYSMIYLDYLHSCPPLILPIAILIVQQFLSPSIHPSIQSSLISPSIYLYTHPLQSSHLFINLPPTYSLVLLLSYILTLLSSHTSIHPAIHTFSIYSDILFFTSSHPSFLYPSLPYIYPNIYPANLAFLHQSITTVFFLLSIYSSFYQATGRPPIHSSFPPFTRLLPFHLCP